MSKKWTEEEIKNLVENYGKKRARIRNNGFKEDILRFGKKFIEGTEEDVKRFCEIVVKRLQQEFLPSYPPPSVRYEEGFADYGAYIRDKKEIWLIMPTALRRIYDGVERENTEVILDGASKIVRYVAHEFYHYMQDIRGELPEERSREWWQPAPEYEREAERFAKDANWDFYRAAKGTRENYFTNIVHEFLQN